MGVPPGHSIAVPAEVDPNEAEPEHARMNAAPTVPSPGPSDPPAPAAEVRVAAAPWRGRRRHPRGGWLATIFLLGCYEPPLEGAFPGDPGRRVEAGGVALHLTPDDLPAGQGALRLGVAPVLGGTMMEAEYRPLTQYVEEILAFPVTLTVASSYGDLIDAIVEGRVDLAILPPASYAMARTREPGLRLLASQIAGGATSYSSHVVVRHDDPARTLGDLRGRRIAFVDERSASGFLLPYAAFLSHGLDPSRDFAAVHFAGSHLAAVRDVLEGRADAAGTFSGMLAFSRREASGLALDAGEVRILHKAGRVPYDALAASPALSDAARAKVAAAFIGLSTLSPRGRAVYRDTSNSVSGWSVARDEQYEVLRDVIERVSAHRRGEPGEAPP